MKLFVYFSMVAFFACIGCSESLPLTNSTVRPVGGGSNECNVNICFAIDGSGSVSHSEFRLQRDFIMDVASIVSSLGDSMEHTKFAAVQFGGNHSDLLPISPLTNNEVEFLQAVYGAQFQSFPRTSTATGIEYCFFELAAEREGVAEIVLMGDGRDNSDRDAVHSAIMFKEFFGDRAALNVVAYEHSDMAVLRDIANAGGGSVYTVNDYFAVSSHIDDLAHNVCGRPLTL